MTDFYALLRIERGATTDEILRAIAAPPSGIAGDLLADARHALSDPSARAEYDRALARDRAARREFESREAAYLHGDLPAALRHAVRLTELRPEDPEAWYQAAHIAEAMDEHGVAARIAEGGAKMHPEEARLWHRAALSRCAEAVKRADEGETPDFDAGLDLMRRAVVADPGTRLFEYEHVRLLASCGRPLEAIRHAEGYILADRAIAFDDLPFLQLLFDLHMNLDLEMGMRGTAAAMKRIFVEEPVQRLEVAETLIRQIEAHLANGRARELRNLFGVAFEGAFEAEEGERRDDLLGALGEAHHRIEVAEELPILRDDPSLVAQAATGFSLILLDRQEEARPYRERGEVLRGGIASLPTEAIERDLARLRERYPATWIAFGERLEAIFAPDVLLPPPDDGGA